MIFSAAFLLSFTSAAAWANIAPGTYYIVSRVLSFSQPPLAITFNGVSQAATVTTLAFSVAQQWVISDYTLNTQIIAPANNNGACVAAWGDGVVTVLPVHGYAWAVNTGDGFRYTIQDGGLACNWALNIVESGSPVVIGTGPPSGDESNWLFQPV